MYTTLCSQRPAFVKQTQTRLKLLLLLLLFFIIIVIIIVIIKIESAVQGRERVRTLDQSNDPTPHNQPMEGRKGKNRRRQKERAD